jgi:hypothetical protein
VWLYRTITFIVKMRHCLRDMLHDSQFTPESFMASYGKTIKPYVFFGMSRFQHFTVNKSVPGKKNKKL